MAGLYRYQMAPAAAAQTVPHYWPRDCGIALDGQRPVLLMMLHPRCPCSAASLHELNELISRAGDQVDARVLFVVPSGAPSDWPAGALWDQAAAIPGVKLLVDRDGKASKAFDATNSGQVVLYNSAGTLLFKGGITDGRGHEGDNAGLMAVRTILRHGLTQTASTPVYGCSLGVCSTANDRSTP